WHAHDVVIKGNELHQDDTDSLTSKFLLIHAANNCVIEGNYVHDLGSASSTPNQPEMILADTTLPFFVGKPTSVSSDGRVLQIGTLRGNHALSPTLVVSIISADDPVDKRWYRV